jgi:hypothetical protein
MLLDKARPSLSTPGAVFYGLLVYVAFQQQSDAFSLITIGFIFIVPLVLGVITMYLRRGYCHRTWHKILTPWISCVAFIAILALLGWEAWICLMMALPVLFVTSSVGGFLGCALSTPKKDGGSNTFMLLGVMALPFVVTPLEVQGTRPTMIRTVETAVIINASPETIWQNIIRVPDIQPKERTLALSHLMGLPEPIGATLNEEGFGTVRQGHFADGLLFNETITAWEPLHKVSFDIEADTSQADKAYLQMIGSDYVDILGGTYLLEPLADGRIRLSFTSQHRLSTNFNFYSGLWSDFLIRDFQNYILRVIKARVEA